jgi:UDP-N-acetylglucosamine 2-epimerase (non-hydrolysing)
MKIIRILCVVGTRPEAIKMAPVIMALKEKEWADVKILATAQHREMSDQVYSLFEIEPDYDLNIMKADQGLVELTAKLLVNLNEILQKVKPNVVLAQGDTTTVMTTALACFYNKIMFGHVEAGLRTNDIFSPFPEEMNRVVSSHLTTLHFAPTESAKKNLLKENIPINNIHVTGNTVIDALLKTSQTDYELGIDLDTSKRTILLTSHRRENFGKPMQESFSAILELVDQNEDIQLIYPVHPNPNVKGIAYKTFDNHDRIYLTEPLSYAHFVQAMKMSYIIITDSGGIQEEAPALGKPVLVLREETERPEAVQAGVVKLVGTRKSDILEQANKLLSNGDYYRSFAKGISPYGDGAAAKRIVKIIYDFCKNC